MERYDNGAYLRIHFLKAISHRLGTHTKAFHVTSEDDSDGDASIQQAGVNSTPQPLTKPLSSDMCEVCLVAPHNRVVLVPCGHLWFCTTYVPRLLQRWLMAITCAKLQCDRMDILSLLMLYFYLFLKFHLIGQNAGGPRSHLLSL